MWSSQMPVDCWPTSVICAARVPLAPAADVATSEEEVGLTYQVEPVNGLTTCDGAVVEPAAVSVPVTVTDVQPGALTVNVAAPVPDEFAATVTGWGRFQLLDVSVTELPADTDRPLLPAVLATLTVMPAAGAADSETPNT